MSRSILCGLDQTSGSRHAASIAARLARDLDSRALLVRVTGRGGLLRRLPLGRSRRTRRKVRAIAEELGFPEGTGIRVKAGDPASVLMALAEAEDAELIVVGSRGRSKLGSLVHGSVPTQLAAEGRTAVVALPLETQLEPGSGHYELVAATH